MRIPGVRTITGLLRRFRGPVLYRRMVRSAIPIEPTLAPALIVVPHADDETFACGGIIALKRQANVPVTIAILTDGTASHPHLDPAEVTQMRHAEALDAVAQLGVPADAVIFLDLPDGGLLALPSDQQSTVVRRLAELIITTRPVEVYVPHRTDRHPDHEATNALTRRAIADSGSAGEAVTLMECPIWLLWWAPLTQPARRMNLAGACRVPIGPAVAKKSSAIAVYRSQLPGMPWKFMDQFTGDFELFFRYLPGDASRGPSA